MESGPRSTFEMVEAEFLLELLMSLLADPPVLDRSGELSERCPGRQVRHIVLPFSTRPPFPNEPDLVAGHALHAIVAHPVLVAVGHANTASRKQAGQPAFGATPPVVHGGGKAGHWSVGEVLTRAEESPASG